MIFNKLKCGKFYNQISKATFKPKTFRQILRQKPTK